MKAVGILTDSPNTTPSAGVVSNGRVSKTSRHGHHHGNRDIENEEVQMYLSKLRDLVPFMPRGRRLSKLEVIQNVIDYICDLQSALETHPTAAGAVGAFDAAAVLSRGSNILMSGPQTASGTTRQPLGVRSSSPNTILGGSTSQHSHSTTSPSSSLSTNTFTHSQPTSEKQPPSSPTDGRSVSSSC